MREIIPFKKDIVFKTRINEITDIALEHDYKIMDSMIEGEFIISGAYKMTEASVINEDFFYKVPFSIAINGDVKKESIDLTIKDFNYEIENSDILRIDTSLLLNCELKEESIEDERNEDEEIIEAVDEVLEGVEDKIEEVRDDIEEVKEKVEEVLEENQEKEVVTLKKEEKLEEKEIDSIVDSVKEKNEYVTYKVYLARENDTFESISTKYDIDINVLRNYNEEDINVGDKIIIPYIFDEK